MQQAYFRPTARFDLGEEVRAHANSGIDVSDGLLQDLGHVLHASGVGARLTSTCIPICSGATLDDALRGGDDYELLCTARQLPSFIRVGEIVAGSGILLDDEEIDPRGFNHFIA
jgi:thiamine-monophosphate kinase